MTRFVYSLALLAALLWAAPVGLAHAADTPTRQTFEATGQTFESNGVTLWYTVQGQGEPVVLLHGLGWSAWVNWALPGTTALLATHYRVIALDMRGHGLSDRPTTADAYGPEMVTDIARLLDHLHISQAHIVGYSMGGFVAANFLVNYPDRVLSGTLAGAGWLQVGSAAERTFAHFGRPDTHNPHVLAARGLAQLALTERQIQSVRAPVTILVGDEDAEVNALYIEPLRRVRPDWPVVRIRDAEHVTCILRPQFGEAILAWLKKNSK